MFRTLIRKFHLFYIEQLWYLNTVPRDAVVLDIGSGLSPCIRSNVLCEKYVLDDAERNGPLIADRPLILGDIQCLPLQDRSVDYVICNQVLEHIPNLESAIAELQRVAPRGHIETPGDFYERISGYPFHLWYTDINDGTLQFKEKKSVYHDDAVRQGIERIKAKTPRAFEEMIYKNYGLFVNRLEWEKNVPVTIERVENGLSSQSTDEKAATRLEDIPVLRERFASISFSSRSLLSCRNGRDIKFWIKNLLSKHYKKSINIWPLLACPTCKSSIEKKNPQALFCQRCNVYYPLLDSVPGLLPEFAQSKCF